MNDEIIKTEQEKKVEEVVVEKKYISIDDFAKVDLRVGQILSVEKVPDTDKLLKLSVDMGEESPRQIVSGIALYFEDINVLVNRKCMFVANLQPRMIRGLESNGMIMAVSTEDGLSAQAGKFSLLSPNDEIPVGTRAK